MPRKPCWSRVFVTIRTRRLDPRPCRGRLVLSENVSADYLAFYVERFNTVGSHRSSHMKRQSITRHIPQKSLPLNENLQIRNKNWLDASLAESASGAQNRASPSGLFACAWASGFVEDVQTSTVLNVLLSGVGGGSDNFPFHFMFFPTASLLSFEGISMIAVVTWITAVECRVVNLLPYPSLP